MSNLTANAKNAQIDLQARIEEIMETRNIDYDTAFEEVYELGADLAVPDEFEMKEDFDELECLNLDDDFDLVGSFSGGEW